MVAGRVLGVHRGRFVVAAVAGAILIAALGGTPVGVRRDAGGQLSAVREQALPAALPRQPVALVGSDFENRLSGKGSRQGLFPNG